MYSFVALKADGSYRAWGHSGYGGTGPSADNGYIKIYSTTNAFAALKSDGSITAWGYAGQGGTGAPTDSGYTKIYSALPLPHSKPMALLPLGVKTIMAVTAHPQITVIIGFTLQLGFCSTQNRRFY